MHLQEDKLAEERLDAICKDFSCLLPCPVESRAFWVYPLLVSIDNILESLFLNLLFMGANQAGVWKVKTHSAVDLYTRIPRLRSFEEDKAAFI